MTKIIQTKNLSNGMKIEFIDRSNRYYGDYHRVCIEVRCVFSLTTAVLEQLSDLEVERVNIRKLLGEKYVYTRVLEKMGVPGDAVEDTRRSLIDSFAGSAFSYMAQPSFPLRLIARELERRSKVHRPSWDLQ
jgi:hypothetical protein